MIRIMPDGKTIKFTTDEDSVSVPLEFVQEAYKALRGTPSENVVIIGRKKNVLLVDGVVLSRKEVENAMRLVK